MPSGRDSFRRNRVAPFLYYTTATAGKVRGALAGWPWIECQITVNDKQQLGTPVRLAR